MKLAIIGAGMIVKEFLETTLYLNEIELCAIYGRESSRENLNYLKEKYNIGHIYHNYEELLKSDVDTIYIALPNNLHFEYAKCALEAGKNIIVEKPITSNFKEAKLLSDIARERKLFIFEAITNQHLPNYKKIKELLSKVGNIKIIQCNYSQYSSRYNSFKEGKVLPAFDLNFSGGALMDLNIYNIYYVVGLFGKPSNVEYYPNIERGIDTSGILILEYDNFKAVCIGAKDCKGPLSNTIQGEKGTILVNTPTSVCEEVSLLINDGTENKYKENNDTHRMIYEFIVFNNIIKENDLEECYRLLDLSLIVSEVQAIAIEKSGIVFPADKSI